MSRALRRCALFILLAFALALAQQAALRHELGHAFQRLAAPEQPQSPASDICEKCFAFCAFAGALPSATLSLPPVEAPAGIDAFIPISPLARTVVTARSRAPPRIS